jgi:hypothetical protein
LLRKFLQNESVKTLLASAFALLVLASASVHAASDADVSIIKAEKVIIEEDSITIVAEAKTSVTLIQDDPNPDHKGAKWLGRPVHRIPVKSDKATFVLKRPKEAGLQEPWKTSLKNARDLQDGKEVGRIGFYSPDMVIKGNLIDSMTGLGFLFAKGE